MRRKRNEKKSRPEQSGPLFTKEVWESLFQKKKRKNIKSKEENKMVFSFSLCCGYVRRFVVLSGVLSPTKPIMCNIVISRVCNSQGPATMWKFHHGTIYKRAQMCHRSKSWQPAEKENEKGRHHHCWWSWYYSIENPIWKHSVFYCLLFVPYLFDAEWHVVSFLILIRMLMVT